MAVGPMLGVLPSFTVGTGATFASERRLDDWPLGQLQELARSGSGGPYTKCGRAARAWSGTLFLSGEFVPQEFATESKISMG